MLVAVGYEVRIDDELCIGSGTCVALVPSFFAFDDEGIAKVEQQGERPDDALLLEAARNCPSGAIQLTLDGEAVDF